MSRSHTLEAPGIELREIDRSQVEKPDYSLPNAPACLVTGFASRGEDYTPQWINSTSTLDATYGTPTNELETWFYNAICGILDRGGIAITAKLPYDNASLQKYTWREWSVDSSITPIKIEWNDGQIEYVKDIYYKLQEVLEPMHKTSKLGEIDEATLRLMWKLIVQLASSAPINAQKIYEDDDPSKDVTSLVFSLNDGSTAKCDDTVGGCAQALEKIIKIIGMSPYAALKLNDTELTSYLEIHDVGSGVADLDTLDKHLTYSKALLKNHIRVYDITHGQYSTYSTHNCVSSVIKNESQDIVAQTNDCLGIVPVLVTATNALYFQNLLETFNGSFDNDFDQLAIQRFNLISGFGTLESGNVGLSSLADVVTADFDPINLSGEWLTVPLSSPNPARDSSDGQYFRFEESTTKDAADLFPEINWRDDKHFEKDHLKDIGVVVFKAMEDTANNSRISFIAVESFVGSLDRTAKDKTTEASTFIDNVVNSRSKYIRLFSNVDKKNLDRVSTLAICNQRATSLGFHQVQCKKSVTLQTSIIDALSKILDQCKDPNTIPLDLVVDAGVSNIAQLVESSGYDSEDGLGRALDLDLYPRVADFGTANSEALCRCGCEASSQVKSWSLNSVEDTRKWRAVLKKLDDFCKTTRKDCLLLADGPRTFCLEGDEKLVRKTKPSSSVASTIVPKVKYIADALNSSYSAGWCNWFMVEDVHSGDFFWCPPSIKAASICIYCDTYFHPWEAPAGMTRGIVPNAVDVAFNPTNDEAGKMYNHNWNYAASYPLDGIVMEGQKTFQTNQTALDRINVRRLMLDLEKQVTQVARHFLYEGNTSWLRQRFVDQITPIFEDAVTGNGILDYAIKCDDELNTEQAIENHELHCKIAVKPVKTLEWIVLTFICTRQGANVDEEVLK